MIRNPVDYSPEVDVRVHDHPVRFAIRLRNVPVQAHRNRVANPSHRSLPSSPPSERQSISNPKLGRTLQQATRAQAGSVVLVVIGSCRKIFGRFPIRFHEIVFEYSTAKRGSSPAPAAVPFGVRPVKPPAHSTSSANTTATAPERASGRGHAKRVTRTSQSRCP